jgi:hypothetical protein
MSRAVLYIIIFAGLTSCVKETDWPVTGDLPGLMAVEATLTDEQKIHRIRLSKPAGNLNEAGEPLTGSTILISNDDSTWTFREDTSNPGDYISDTIFSARLDRDYLLQIYSGGKQYSARAGMVPGIFFHELRYVQNEGTGWYHIDWVASAFVTENPAMWEALIDWSAVPGFENTAPDSCRARLLFYSLPTLDISEIFAPVVEQTSFPSGTVITQRRYSLSPGHAEFIRQLLLETTWQGSLFPTTNANVITNLSEGAIGYFGVCAVTQLSLIVE